MNLPSIAVIIIAFAVLLPSGALTTTSRLEETNRDLQNFHPITGLDCVRTHFIRYSHVRTSEECATACNRLHDCQAFSVSEGRCKMFVFNKCSKDIRSCICNRLTRVFVKKHPGVRPGSLCPSDFGFNKCGVKYKFVQDTNRWDVGMEKCSAEPGLVIMAEPISINKLNYVAWLYENRFKQSSDRNKYYYLGGRQDPGSSEPAGGWHWWTCRIPIASNLWLPGEPNNYGDGEELVCSQNNNQLNGQLVDCPDDMFESKGLFCECASPFD